MCVVLEETNQAQRVLCLQEAPLQIVYWFFSCSVDVNRYSASRLFSCGGTTGGDKSGVTFFHAV